MLAAAQGSSAAVAQEAAAAAALSAAAFASALDAGTEGKVMKALDEVMKNRTTFVIAHRLSTVRKASRILVFEAGKIVEAGTFDELVAQGGRLADLARQQFIVTEPAPKPI